MCCRAADCYHRSVILEDFSSLVRRNCRPKLQSIAGGRTRPRACVRGKGAGHRALQYPTPASNGSDRRKCSASPLGASLGASPHCRFEDCHPLYGEEFDPRFRRNACIGVNGRRRLLSRQPRFRLFSYHLSAEAGHA